MDKKTAILKKEFLIRYLEKLESLLVAFSGGVDSTFLLDLAHHVLREKAVAATSCSMSLPSLEREEAIQFARYKGIQHVVFESNEMHLPEFLANSRDRCYHCKKSLSLQLLQIAKEKGLKHVALATNVDDLKDYRPGLKAAEERGILSPLVEAGLNKEEIRFLSNEAGLATWDKPAMACLASRIPYGDAITEKKLKMVEEAEGVLSENGFRQCRVRHHGPVARIEVERDEIKRITEFAMGGKIIKRFKEIGFLHIAVDLEGYLSGSLNRMLDIPRQPLDILQKKEGLSDNES